MTNEWLFPKFSILNPETCFSLPAYQVACGVSDIIAHLNERYLTTTPNVELSDRLIESTIRTVCANVPLVLEQPDNYDAWAEIMWCGTLAHNELMNAGRATDWASHNIEHEISGIYDLAHGAGLAIVFPAYMWYVYRRDVNRFAQYAVRAWHADPDLLSPERTALEGIRRYRSFLHAIGLPTTLTEAGIVDDRIEEMARKCTNGNQDPIGGFAGLNQADIEIILKAAR